MIYLKRVMCFFIFSCLFAASSLFSSNIPTYILSGRQNQEIALSNGAVFEAHFCSDIKINDWSSNDELMIFYTEQFVVDLRNLPNFHSQKPIIQFRNITQDSRISSTMISPPNFWRLEHSGRGCDFRSSDFKRRLRLGHS